VSPEQMMKDKAEYARKGISRGRSLVTLEFGDGILLVAENPSTLLHKISEIYDRIAFAGVGKYNEFENLRIAGIRHADVKGYSYSRGDVTAKALANAYSQALGNIFTQDIKPFEIEVLVAEVAESTSISNGLMSCVKMTSSRSRSRCSWPRWPSRTARRTRSTTSSTTARSRTSTTMRRWEARPTRSGGSSRTTTARGCRSARRSGSACGR